MDHLIDYLNDHLAGAVGALELIEHLIEQSEEGEFKSFCIRLRDDVQADVADLRGLMKRRGASESCVKKAGAWFAEKATRIKLMLGEDSMGMGRLQALEGLCLGITGKRALWAALRAVESDPGAAGFGLNLERLIGRAEGQLDLTERERLKTARRALAGSSNP